MKQKSESRRLVFAYIPYFKSLSKANLNFDPQFEFLYHPDSQILTIRHDEKFIRNFWPENISTVSVIAGKNGAGKSSVLYWLLGRCLGDFVSGAFNGVIGIYENNSIHIFHDGSIKEEKSPNEINGISVSYKDVSSENAIRIASQIAIRPIYYSGHFYCNMGFGDHDGIWNISDKWMLLNEDNGKPDFSDGKESILATLNSHDIENDLRICRLLFDRRFQETFEVNHRSGLKLPRYIVMIAKTWIDGAIDRRIERLQNKIKESSKKRKYPKSEIRLLKMIKDVEVNPVMKGIDENEGKSGLTEFLHYALKDFILNFLIMQSAPSLLKDFVINLYTEDYVKSETSVSEWIKQVLPIVEDKCEEIEDGLNQKYCRHTVRIFSMLKNTIEFLRGLKWKGGKAYIDCVTIIKDPDFIPPLGPQIYADRFPRLAKSILQDISQLDQFCNITFSHSLQEPSSLSSGEQAMLNLYSRIKYALDNLQTKEDNSRTIVLFLDEAEIGFHPEWQRQFVCKLTKFVSKISGGMPPMQIIYTTHSPITLSDMPKGCVNLLNTISNEPSSVSPDNKKESFGANVFELYGDSFFMENGLIGEFATEKIKSLDEDIDKFISSPNQRRENNIIISSTDKVKSLRDRIDMIGDERIRSYLHSKLDRVDPRDEIRRLKERMAILEWQLNSVDEKN